MLSGRSVSWFRPLTALGAGRSLFGVSLVGELLVGYMCPPTSPTKQTRGGTSEVPPPCRGSIGR